MAKKTMKRLTAREKKERAETKKWLQENGLLPPDKPKLNRKQYIKDSFEAWDERPLCYNWEGYLVHAAAFISTKRDRRGQLTAEAVGAAKTLRCAIRLHQLVEQTKAEGGTVTIGMELDALKEILDA